jgi:hypothetical protein
MPMPTMVPDLVLVIYLHGFKGDESTFLKFPERMNHIVAETLPDCVVESVVFPAYEVGPPCFRPRSLGRLPQTR